MCMAITMTNTVDSCTANLAGHSTSQFLRLGLQLLIMLAVVMPLKEIKQLFKTGGSDTG